MVLTFSIYESELRFTAGTVGLGGVCVSVNRDRIWY